jgi:hypothetical protein
VSELHCCGAFASLAGRGCVRELPRKTIGHIQSAECLGQREVVISARSARIRELMQYHCERVADIIVNGSLTGTHVRLLMIETETSLYSGIKKGVIMIHSS